MYSEAFVAVGAVPIDRLKKWAKSSTRFAELMSEEARFQEAFEVARKQMRERKIPEKYIEYIDRDVFNETMRANILVLFARASVERYFQRKSDSEIEAETLGNPDWIAKAMEEAIRWVVMSTERTAKKFELWS